MLYNYACGTAIPNQEHAISVSLPTWQDVVAYEEQEPQLLANLQTGYPRFFIAKSVRQLIIIVQQELQLGAESRIVLLPTQDSAERAKQFIMEYAYQAYWLSWRNIFVIVTCADGEKIAYQYWQYSGDIITSRQALDLQQGIVREPVKMTMSKLSALVSSTKNDSFFFATGMAANYAMLRLAQLLQPAKKSLQIGFPYVDLLKIQQFFHHDFDHVMLHDERDLETVTSAILQGKYSIVFCEFPSNPLLACDDIKALLQSCRDSDTLLVLDDSMASSYNINLLPYADVVVSSLTKWFSGMGNVMGGCIQVNQDGKQQVAIKQFLSSQQYMYPADAEVLLSNAGKYQQRMPIINANGLAVYQFLLNHPAVEQVWYPLQQRAVYDKFKNNNGGYGGLISFVLNAEKQDMEQITSAFYNHITCAKGPSFGMEKTLLCPYVLLAYYNQLRWVEQHGCSRYLLRLSVGIEPIASIINCLEQALQIVSSVKD